MPLASTRTFASSAQLRVVRNGLEYEKLLWRRKFESCFETVHRTGASAAKNPVLARSLHRNKIYRWRRLVI